VSLRMGGENTYNTQKMHQRIHCVIRNIEYKRHDWLTMSFMFHKRIDWPKAGPVQVQCIKLFRVHKLYYMIRKENYKKC